ncbi:hypothetical protein K2X92_06045 [Candidatus Gracilibacteria bacterium]|nr:hypothetical protein [Candidatus Gracilibacteria bacterium]
MFALNRVSSSEKENEPKGLFNVIIDSLKQLKEKVLVIDNRQHYELDNCPSYGSYIETFFKIIENIDLIRNRLQNLDEEINELFYIQLAEDIVDVQFLFESLVETNKKLQLEFKDILDNDVNTINGDTLVIEISQARRSILGLITHIKKIGNPNNQTAKKIQTAQIIDFPITAIDTINSEDGFYDTSTGNISTISDNLSTTPDSIFTTPESDTIGAHQKSTTGKTGLATAQVRRHAIQQLVFKSSGEILPNNVVTNKHNKIRELLGENASAFNWDSNAVNDEPTVNYEIEDGRIIRNIIERAKIDRDGAMIQSIKNNLIRNAANDEAYDLGLETSILLADHMKNIRTSNPIILDTVEYGRISIVSSETIDQGEMTRYKANIVLNNGDRVTWLLHANGCVVGDLSNSKIGEYDNNNKLIITNEPCTIRRIRSRIVSQEVKDTGFFKNVGSNIKSGFNSLVNRFKFGKK